MKKVVEDEKYISNKTFRQRRHNSVMETGHEKARMKKAANMTTWPMQLSNTFIEPERHQ